MYIMRSVVLILTLLLVALYCHHRSRSDDSTPVLA